MKWNPQTDKISYNVKLNFSSKRNNKHAEPNINLTNVPLKLPTILTKRQILSQINRIYDPLGLISPFTIKGKIAMRRLWTYEEKSIGMTQFQIPYLKNGETFSRNLRNCKILVYPDVQNPTILWETPN